MGEYKYPYIPRELYAPVMYACKLIREHGTFHWAVNAAAKYYGVSADEIEKHVRARQAAGQRGTTRAYNWYVITGYSDVCGWANYNDGYVWLSTEDPEQWEKEKEKAGIIIRATSAANAKKQLANDRKVIITKLIDGRKSEKCVELWKVVECRPFKTKAEAEKHLQEYYER